MTAREHVLRGWQEHLNADIAWAVDHYVRATGDREFLLNQGARLILEGRIDKTGVHIPVKPEIYNPVLDELERLGIKCVEKTNVMPCSALYSSCLRRRRSVSSIARCIEPVTRSA